MKKKPPPDPPVRKTVALPQRVWDGVAEYRFRARINSERGAMERVVVAGLRALKVRKGDAENDG